MPLLLRVKDLVGLAVQINKNEEIGAIEGPKSQAVWYYVTYINLGDATNDCRYNRTEFPDEAVCDWTENKDPFVFQLKPWLNGFVRLAISIP